MKKKLIMKKLCRMLFCGMLFGLVVIQPDFFYASQEALNSVQGKFDALYEIIATFISGIGMIVALMCVAEIGGSWMGHGNGGAQFEAFKRMGGAVLWMAAPQLIVLFV